MKDQDHARQPITDAYDAVAVLGGDPAERIIRTHVSAGSEWHLERDRRQVDGDVIKVLRDGGWLLERLTGKLAPVADGLFPEPSMAQSWVWRPANAQVQ